MRTQTYTMLALALGLSSCALAQDVKPSPAGLDVAPEILSLPPAPSPTAAWQRPGRQDLSEGQSGESWATGTVGGQVVNGTRGGEVPTGLEVTLHAVDGGEVVYRETTHVDADGRFRFEGVEAVPGRLHYVTTEYKGVRFAGAGGVFPLENAEALEVPVVVYESTADASQVRVAVLHLVFLGPREGMVNVGEIWVFSNRGDRVVVPSQGEWLVEVVLPDGAQVREVRGTGVDDRFAGTTAGFRFSTAVLPGEGTARLTVHFSLPYEGQLDLAQPLVLAADSAVILVEEGQMRAVGRELADLGSASLAGTALRQFVAGPFEPGDTLTVSLVSDASPWPVVVGSVALAAALAAAVVRWLWLRRGSTGVGALRSAASMECSESLLQAMAELDDAFDAGGLPEAEYRARRQELKGRLMARMGERRD